MDKRNQWHEWLNSKSAEQQVMALRQIATQENVVGLCATAVELAGSRDDEVRMWAAEALETSLQPQADEVEPLAKLLESADDGEIAYWAATMLGRLARQAAAAVPALERCLRESLYLPAREQATWALCQIGPQASVAVPTLKAAAEQAPPRLQRLASAAIEAIGEAA